MAKKASPAVVDFSDLHDEIDEKIHVPVILIPVSKQEKDRLLASYELTKRIAGRGMRYGQKAAEGSHDRRKENGSMGAHVGPT